MKKVINIFLVLICFLTVHSKSKVIPSTNSWINYSQSYLKFKIYENGICRLNYNDLVANGFTTFSGNQLQLFRYGKEIPLKVSTSGTFTSSDFVEFYAQKADGSIDHYMFNDSTKLSNANQAMFHDTATYFLTVSPGSTNYLRYTVNSTSTASLPITDIYLRNFSFYGSSWSPYPAVFYPPTSTAEPLYSSDYYNQKGRYYLYAEYTNSGNQVYSINFSLPNIVPNSLVYMKFEASHFINTTNGYLSFHEPFEISLKINNNNIFDTSIAVPYFSNGFNKYHQANKSLSFSSNLLQNINQITIGRINNFVNYTDRKVKDIFRNFEIFAPTTSTVLNANFQEIYLPIISSPIALKLTGLSPNVTYFFTNTITKSTETSVSNSLGEAIFYVSNNSNIENKFLLFKSNSQPVTPLNFEFKNFSNHFATGINNNYLIITNKRLLQDNLGNPVADYVEYRKSIDGGSFKAAYYTIDDIENQFGYGISGHPFAIKAFVNMAYNQWQLNDKSCLFIIGKGIAPELYNTYSSNSNYINQFPIIVNYGFPGTDFLYGDIDNDKIPELSIGRISAKNANQVRVYLSNVKKFESQNVFSAQPKVDDYLWLKNNLYLGGADLTDNSLQIQINSTFNDAKIRNEADSLGGKATMYSKNSSSSQFNSATAYHELQTVGQRYITYFGHSNKFDLSFNLPAPDIMDNVDKQFHLSVLGCEAGDQYLLNTANSFSENFIAHSNRGAISVFGTSSLGWPGQMESIITNIASLKSKGGYLDRYGTQILKSLRAFYPSTFSVESHIYQNLALTEFNLNGDPGLIGINANKPDFAVEASKYIRTTPEYIDGSVSSIKIKAYLFNLGTYIKNQKIRYSVYKVLANGNTDTIHTGNFNNGIAYKDSIELFFNIKPQLEFGTNKIYLAIDDLNEVDEISELNNLTYIEYTILSNLTQPTFPYNFSIVNYTDLKLFSNTLKPDGAISKYNFEIDTTELFNSPTKMSSSVYSKGGEFSWKPNISMVDSTVYYWRVSKDTNVNPDWRGYSFIYLANSSTGWNQSHYYQYLKNSYSELNLDSNRQFKFGQQMKSVTVKSASLYGNPWYNYSRVSFSVGSNVLMSFSCPPLNNIHFFVFNPVTGQYWGNRVDSVLTGDPYLDKGYFKSLDPSCRGPVPNPNFIYTLTTPTERKQAMDFIDSVPNGYYIGFYNVQSITNGTGSAIPNTLFKDHWMSDTTLFGSGNSLYHKVKSLGFTLIDSFNSNKPFMYFCKKNDNSFTPIQEMTANSTILLEKTFDFNYSKDSGVMVSEPIGPSDEWSWVHQRQFSLDPFQDSSIVQLDVLDSNLNLSGTALSVVPLDTNILFIDKNVFPFASFKWNNLDKKNKTASQLKYWRVNYAEVPDLALSSNIAYSFPDTVVCGEVVNIKVGLRNISHTNVKDSIPVKISILNSNINEIVKIITLPPLKAQDSTIIDYTFNTNNLAGINTIKIEVNPFVNFIEHNYNNNILTKKVFVKGDFFNPNLDVTFDNVRIMNKDLVSAKPVISIKIKDDSKFLLINDTNLVNFDLYQFGSFNTKTKLNYNFSSPQVQFIPATNSSNKSEIIINPTLIDGDYELQFNAKDKSGNKNVLNYTIQFKVINKSSITHLFNYPNPFTTSTRFVFTLTGSRIPNRMKIQIYTVSGKLIKEISKEELGNVHIGNNITEYAWDGKDTYGDPVGNGVYYYRFKSDIDGAEIENKSTSRDDKFIDGFGKMYIMR